MTSSSAATPPASGTPMDLIGKTVRWVEPHTGQWYTARVIREWAGLPGWRGEVIDPGTMRDEDGELEFKAGESVRLVDDYITVIDSEPDTQDPECE